VQARAVDAVFVDLIGKAFANRFGKAEACEELGCSGEQADAAYLVALGLIKERFDQQTSAASFLVLAVDGDGTNFSEVRTVEVESAATDDFAITLSVFGFNDDEVADVFADLRETAREEGSVCGITGDQAKDMLCVWESGFTRVHGCPPLAK
jgi:hypothetical protein